MLAPHQIEAVDRSLDVLQRRGGLLLADDVGLGKSFVAAEVARQWRLRHRAGVEVIVPASILDQWRDTLEQFRVTARVVSHETMAKPALLPASPSSLLIVDEAHAFRNPRTRRFCGLAIRAAGARVLLISATPICNSLDDLHALLRIFAPDDLLADCAVPSIDAAFLSRDQCVLGSILEELMIRRDREVLDAQLQFGALGRTVIRHVVSRHSELSSLRFPLVGSHPAILAFLRRRVESSAAALLESLRRQLRFYERALSAMAAGRSLPKRDYRRAFAREEDRDEFQEILFWELFAPQTDGVDPTAIHGEISTIRALLNDLEREADAKQERLIEIVREESEPMLIFSGFAATAAALHEAISAIRPCGLITSRARSREAVLRSFRSGEIDILISTDMTAEGLNLQRAGVVVHYDLPWNPVKLDQRNGRAWRIGQRRPRIRAFYFVPDWKETGIVRTVAAKNRVRRRTLAGTPAGLRQQSLSTMRPRLGSDCAIVRLGALGLPAVLDRRHRAGIELLLDRIRAGAPGALSIEDLVELIHGVGTRADEDAGAGPLQEWGLEFRA